MRQEYEYAGLGNPPEPESPAADDVEDAADDELLLVDSDLTILSGRLAGDPCGAGLAGMGEGTLCTDDDVTVEESPWLLVTTDR